MSRVKRLEAALIISAVNRGGTTFSTSCGFFRGRLFFYLGITDMDELTFRAVMKADIEKTLEAIWRIFNSCGANGYSVEGKLSFRNFITYNSIIDRYYDGDIMMFICLDKDEIVGAIMVRRPAHICLLFVDKRYHRRGIARRLFDMARNACIKNNERLRHITVNAAPGSIGFYYKLGFVDLNRQITKDGITYVPMKYKVIRKEQQDNFEMR